MNLREQEERMRADWDARAVTPRAGRYFIIDGYKGEEAEFYASGLVHWQDMQAALQHFGAWQPRLDMVGVEIGCGMGRMTVHMAHHFRQFRAYDISANMLKYVPRLPNVTYVAGGVGAVAYLKQYADYVLSMIVFQHMPRTTFLEYIDESHDALRPGGIFCTQLPFGEQDWPDTETLMTRGYTPEWVVANIHPIQWEVLADVAPLAGSELWHWLIMRRR